MVKRHANGIAYFESGGGGTPSSSPGLGKMDDLQPVQGKAKHRQPVGHKTLNLRFLNLVVLVLVFWISEAPTTFFSSENLGAFMVNANLLGGSYFRFGAGDSRSCDTVLDSVENNRGSFVYLGGRTRSRNLVEGVDSRHTSCYPDMVGYIAKFNSGTRNYTKFFHGVAGLDKVLDVPVLRLAGNIDTGASVYSEYVAGMVRYSGKNIVFMLDGKLGEIKNMWYMENHWVSTHKMFHYRNFEFAWVTGSASGPANYRVYVGLTRTIPQPSGWRYWKVRYYSQTIIREIRSEDHSYYYGCNVALWHQNYLWTAGQRDWSGRYGMPFFAKFNRDLTISDAYRIHSGNYYSIESLHSQRGGRNYKMFGLATGYYRNGGDRFNQTYSRDYWNLFYFDNRFARRQYGCDVFFQKQIYPYGRRYGRVDQITGTSTTYFFGFYWSSSSRWKSFQTDGWTSRPWRVTYSTLWISYCRSGYYNYKSYDSGTLYEWHEPCSHGNCYLNRIQMATTGTSTSTLYPFHATYYSGYVNGGRYAVVVRGAPSYYTARGFSNIYYRSFSQRSKYQWINYFRGGCCSYTPGTYTVTAGNHFMITPSTFRKNNGEPDGPTPSLYSLNDYDVRGVSTKVHGFKYRGSNIASWGWPFVLLQDHFYQIDYRTNHVTTIYYTPKELAYLKVKKMPSYPYYTATMADDTNGAHAPFNTRGRNGARFDFYFIGRSGSTWYNVRNLLEIRRDNKTFSVTSPKSSYELVYAYTSSINTRTSWAWDAFNVYSGKVRSGSSYSSGYAGQGFSEYTLEWPSGEYAIGRDVLFPQNDKSERYQYLFCWRNRHACRDLKIDRSLSTKYPLHSNGASRGMPGGHNSRRLPSWPGANFTFNIVGKTLSHPPQYLKVPVRVIITNCGTITVSTHGAIPPQVFTKSWYNSRGSVRFRGAIAASFSTNRAACPVYRYTLRTASGALWTNANIWAKYLDYPPNAGIALNRRTAGTYNFYLRAQAVWSSVYKQLPIQVRVCGEESLALADPLVNITRVYKMQRAALAVRTSVFAGNFTLLPAGDLCPVTGYGVTSRNRTYGVRGRIMFRRLRDRSQSLYIYRYRAIPAMTVSLSARTRGLKYKARPYRFAVCSENSLHTRNRTFEINEVYELKSNNTAVPNKQIIKFASYKKNFAVKKCDLCPVSNYRLIDYRRGTPYTGKDIVMNSTTFDIEIRTSRPVYKRLGVEAYYGNRTQTDCHFIKKVKFAIKVKVCGDEQILVRNKTAEIINIMMGEDKDVAFPLAKLRAQFRMTRFRQCRYHVWISPNMTVTENALAENNKKGWPYAENYNHFMKIDRKQGKFYMNHTDFNITDAYILKENSTFPMFLRASTIGGKTAFRKYFFKINYPWKNTAPRIKGLKQVTNFELSVTQEEQEAGFSNKYVSYTSPRARDLEGDKPIIKATGYERLPCKCATFVAQVDNTFKLELDKSKLTIKDKGRWPVTVTVTDAHFSVFRDKSMYVVSLTIDYKETVITERVQKAVAAQAQAAAAVAKAKREDTFVAPVDDSEAEEVEVTGESISHSEAEWQEAVSEEEMSSVLDSYTAEVEALQRKIHLEKEAQDKIKKAAKAAKAKKRAAMKSTFKGVNMPEEEEEEEEKEPEVPKDVEVNVGGVDRSGNIKMKFNQKLAVPGFIDKGNKPGASKDAKARRLIALSEINVGRDIMDVTFVKTSNGDAQQNFFLSLQDWTEEGMRIHMNMTNPLDVSKGSSGDGVQIGLKNPSLFVSKATGKPLPKAKANLAPSNVPRQLPKGVSEESIAIQAKSAFIGMSTIFIIQFCVQKYLGGSVQALLTLFFTLQLICYMEIYDVPIPGNAEIYIEQFTKIIELQFLAPEPLIQKFLLPDFKIRDYVDNALVVRLQQYIFIGAIAIVITALTCLVGILCFPFRWCKENMLKRSGRWCAHYWFNGLILTLSVLYLPLCLMAADALEDILIEERSLIRRFRKDLTVVDWEDPNVIVALSLAGSLLLLPLVFYAVLRAFGDRIAEPSVKRRISNLYIDISMNDKEEKLAYFPVFLLKRLVFVIIPSVFFWAPYFQLQALVFLTGAYVIFYGGRRPHNDRKRINLELANEAMFMIMNYHLICFSNFNTSDEMQFLMGYSFVGALALTITINLVYLVTRQVEMWKNLGNLKEEKLEKAVAKVEYDKKLTKAKENMVNIMVADIQKQMKANMAQKLKDQMGKHKLGGRNKLDTIAEESVTNLEGLVDGEANGSGFSPLGKKKTNRKRGAVQNLQPQNGIREEDDDGDDVSSPDLFELAQKRHRR